MLLQGKIDFPQKKKKNNNKNLKWSEDLLKHIFKTFKAFIIKHKNHI